MSLSNHTQTQDPVFKETKVILYIATSLDGFIADSKGGVDWLPPPETEDLDDSFGYKKLMDRIDTIVMGNRSYQQIITFGEWAWPDKKTYVFTSKPQSSDLEYIEFTNDSPAAFMEKIRKNQKKDIWLLGGAQLAQSFRKDHLIDEIVLTIIPTKLGQGISLDLPLDAFYLSTQKSCMDNMVQKTYLRHEI